jgi:hypothetical protein
LLIAAALVGLDSDEDVDPPVPLALVDVFLFGDAFLYDTEAVMSGYLTRQHFIFSVIDVPQEHIDLLVSEGVDVLPPEGTSLRWVCRRKLAQAIKEPGKLSHAVRVSDLMKLSEFDDDLFMVSEQAVLTLLPVVEETAPAKKQGAKKNVNEDAASSKKNAGAASKKAAGDEDEDTGKARKKVAVQDAEDQKSAAAETKQKNSSETEHAIHRKKCS